MINRPYRSGAHQACLICRQSEEIQNIVKEMSQTHAYQEIADWLGTQGINASWSQVRWFMVRSKVPMRKKQILPTGTYSEKLVTYIDVLVGQDAKRYTAKGLGLKGPGWSPITIKLHQAGHIEPNRTYSPILYTIISTNEEILEWRDQELARVKTNHTHR